MKRTESIGERLTRRTVVDENGCWIWQGSKDTSGYGLVRIAGRLEKTHRAVLLERGVDLEGLEVDHLCRVRACCNPDHLEAVTHRTNILRSPISPTSINYLKTHCANGHEFTPENTYWRTNASGRDCRECRRTRMRKYRA